MNTFIERVRQAGLIVATSALVAFPGHSTAAPLGLQDVPLFLSTGAEPNLMLMLDSSGSMQNIVPDTPFDPAVTYLASCPAASTVPAATQADIRIVLGVPRIRYSNTNYFFGTGAGQRCFDPATDYLARVHGDDVDRPSGYLAAQYTGNYLNWYFNTATDPAGCSNTWVFSGRKPCTQSRMMIARTAGSTLVDTMSAGMRVGLSTYNSGNAGSLREVIGLLTPAKRTALKSKINALTGSGATPIAETLSDIGRYFATGYTGNLTLHPGQPSQSTATVANVFNNHSFQNDSGQAIVAPIQYSCQKSFAVLLTDGRPQTDQNVSTYLEDYDGDCNGASPACLSYDQKPSRQYESAGSDYLDDVAQALFEMDLRPDLVDPQGARNNVATYLISFADDQAINDPLMKDTADQGGGEFFVAGNETELVAAFQAAFSSIVDQIASASSASVNSGSISSTTRVYQAKFNSGTWTGQLLSFPVNANGSLSPAEWDAANELPLPNSRKIITVNSAGNGVPFRWASLDAARQAQLQPAADGLGNQRLDYLRGDATYEGAGPPPNFRDRPSKLGDIIASSPVFVGDPLFFYRDNLETVPYSSFSAAKKGRPQVVYAGANDGMLHGFDAASGKELLAFVPGEIFANLHELSDPAYLHRYYVDGAPNMGDVFFNGAWHTVLVGGLNKGGQGVYALDITNPGSFTEFNAANIVLWEFDDSDDADLGYTYSQPAIIRMANGKWAAVFGNGYNNTVADGIASATGDAALYIVDLETGALVRKISTLQGTAEDPTGGNRPNGLATPAAVDFNGDTIVDYIFAGDLFGNMWKFDVRNIDPLQWKSAYTSGGVPAPLYQARDAAGNAQPITSRPEVGRGPGGAGMIVLFGTGKYLEQSDKNLAQLKPQTFYGVIDRNSLTSADVVGGRPDLQQQLITDEFVNDFDGFLVPIRVSTDKPLAGFRGWYMDLISPVLGFEGEMQVSNSILRNGRIVFTTLIPDPNPCGFGGTSWLMEIDALSGSRLAETPFDLNNDGIFDENDFVEITLPDGTKLSVPVSGRKSEVGIMPTPGVLAGPDAEYKYTPGTTGAIQITTENPGVGGSGRQSWRQVR